MCIKLGIPHVTLKSSDGSIIWDSVSNIKHSCYFPPLYSIESVSDGRMDGTGTTAREGDVTNLAHVLYRKVKPVHSHSYCTHVGPKCLKTTILHRLDVIDIHFHKLGDRLKPCSGKHVFSSPPDPLRESELSDM